MTAPLDPLREQDARLFLELFHDEKSYELQRGRMVDGLQSIKKAYDENGKKKETKIQTLRGMAAKLQDNMGRTVMHIMKGMAQLLEDFTVDSVSFIWESVDWMASYIESKTQDYHRILVVMSQEVQENMDSHKEVQYTNRFQIKELQARVTSLEDQFQKFKDEVLTENLRSMLKTCILQNREVGHLGAPSLSGQLRSVQGSGRSTPSRGTSVASSYQSSMHRMAQARSMGHVPSMIAEAQFQATLLRGQHTMDMFD